MNVEPQIAQLLTDIKSRDEGRRRKAACSLRDVVSARAHEMSGERFVVFMNWISNQIFETLKSEVRRYTQYRGAVGRVVGQRGRSGAMGGVEILFITCPV